MINREYELSLQSEQDFYWFDFFHQFQIEIQSEKNHAQFHLSGCNQIGEHNRFELKIDVRD